jgi:hypothetical protein
MVDSVTYAQARDRANEAHCADWYDASGEALDVILSCDDGTAVYRAFQDGSDFGSKYVLESAALLNMTDFVRHKENCRIYRMDNNCTCGLHDALQAFTKFKKDVAGE